MKDITIALIPNFALGDGLVALIIANNLLKNGFKVTVFHNTLEPLNDWFNYDIMKFPLENHKQVLDEFDVVLTDHATPLLDDLYPPEQHLAVSREYIFFAFTIFDERFFHDHRERLQKKMGDEKAHLLRYIATCGRQVKYGKNLSMVENTTKFCRETLKLKNVDDHIGFVLPDNYIRHSYSDRVVISPTSSIDRKNWPLHKYVLVAKMLKRAGFSPVFSFSPEERRLWADQIPSEFHIPRITSLRDFAVLLYESHSFIGNDSGGGHFASALGLPTLTIVRSRKKKNFKWRPGWGKNTVVAPDFSFSFMGKRYWHSFLSVNKVYRRFLQLINGENL
jgi:hypothetical protein